MNSVFHAMPEPLKSFTVSLVAYRKMRRKYGHYFKKYFKQLVESKADEQDKRAEAELHEFLDHIRNTNQFYTVPRDNDLTKMPIIDKETVIHNFTKISQEKPFIIGKSSGTTGQPLPVPYNIQAYQKEYAFWWYFRSFWDVKRGDRVATVAGHKIAHINRSKAPFWVMNHSENQLIMSSYHLSKSNMGFYIDELNKFRPLFIHGYPSSIYLLARYILDNDIQINFQPQAIMTASESILDFQKATIEAAFHCKQRVWYGNTEFCGHITECPNGKLHVQPYHSYVRIVDQQGHDVAEGEEGVIVATNFANTAFPLINYNMKDAARLSKKQQCGCRKGGRVVDYIVGRVEDYIYLADGRLIGRLDHLFKDAKHVRNAQIEQKKLGEVIIRIEKKDGYNSKIEKKILHEARNRLGRETACVFEYVNEIPKDTNGKFKFVIQKIGSFSKSLSRDTIEEHE